MKNVCYPKRCWNPPLHRGTHVCGPCWGELHAALRSGIREAARIQKVLSGEDMLEVEDEPATSSYMLRGDPTPSKLQVAVAVSTAKQAGGGAKAAGKGRKRKVGRGMEVVVVYRLLGTSEASGHSMRFLSIRTVLWLAAKTYRLSCSDAWLQFHQTSVSACQGPRAACLCEPVCVSLCLWFLFM